MSFWTRPHAVSKKPGWYGHRHVHVVGHREPPTILAPMYSQGFLSISPISLLPWLYMTFLLNFGMSTMQRLHIRYTHGRLKSVPKKRPRR